MMAEKIINSRDYCDDVIDKRIVMRTTQNTLSWFNGRELNIITDEYPEYVEITVRGEAETVPASGNGKMVLKKEIVSRQRKSPYVIFRGDLLPEGGYYASATSRLDYSADGKFPPTHFMASVVNVLSSFVGSIIDSVDAGFLAAGKDDTANG